MRFSTALVVAVAAAPAIVSAIPLEARAAAPAGGAKPAGGAAKPAAGRGGPRSTVGQWADVAGGVARIGTSIAEHVANTRAREFVDELVAREFEELEARAAAAKPAAGGGKSRSTAGQWADVAGGLMGIGTSIVQHVANTRARDFTEDILARDFEELEARDFEDLEARAARSGGGKGRSVGQIAGAVGQAAQFGTAIAQMFTPPPKPAAREYIEDIIAREYFDELVSREVEARAARGRGPPTAVTAGQIVGAAGDIANLGMAIHGAVTANRGKREDFEDLFAREMELDALL